MIDIIIALSILLITATVCAAFYMRQFYRLRYLMTSGNWDGKWMSNWDSSSVHFTARDDPKRTYGFSDAVKRQKMLDAHKELNVPVPTIPEPKSSAMGQWAN